MKRFIEYTGLFLFLTTSQLLFSQNHEKIFYNKDWKGCNESKASFYRLLTIDSNGKPVGKILDYYITGELQCEIDGALFIDKEDDYNSNTVGKSIGYYKSGKKNFELVSDSNGNKISNTHWYENGIIKYQQEFKNGKLKDKWYKECDENGICQKVFYEGFETAEDQNGWEVADLEEYKSEIIAGEGLLMNSKSEEGFAQYINLPIDVTSNFSIETIMNFKKGKINSIHALIYGFKDWNNYYYFYLTANGQYRIGVIKDGINQDFAPWSYSNYINQNSSRNLIRINKVKNRISFSINSSIVAIADNGDSYVFKGNKIGFYITSKRSSVLFERLIVRQDIGVNDNFPKLSSNSKWKGNGTGFFIDARGYITTNFHVIENASEIEIDLIQNGQKKSFNAKVISSDKQNDLAIVKIDDPNFKPYLKLPYNLRTQLSDVGTNVFALGYPMALSVMGADVKFTDGKISSKTGYQGDITTYQISVPVQPGNSGGPLFDYEGNIIGIISAKIMEADNVSYAIKSNYLQNLIEVVPDNLYLPSDKKIAAITLTEKIKVLSDFVVLIKVK
jgi:S1-C subfamily serine protease/antitoxin component YwqK of YwqJK toxin-antitoxin module